MTFQEMKDLLLKYPNMTEKIYNAKKEIELARESANALREAKSATVDGMPHGTDLSDSTYSKAERIISKYDNRINRLLDEIERSFNEQQRIVDLLKMLSPDEYKIIKARYLDGIYWDYIPGKINISRRHCFRLHDSAILKMISQI